MLDRTPAGDGSKFEKMTWGKREGIGKWKRKKKGGETNLGYCVTKF